jgi:hypothetical protein
MIAAHHPNKAAFQLDYGLDHLLSRVRFLPYYSDAPSLESQPNGPQMEELISQITELYLRRW